MQGMLHSTWGGPVKWAGRLCRKVIADTVIEKRTKGRGPGHPWGTTKTNWTPQQHTTSKNGCKAWGKMLWKWRWEMAKWVIVGLSRGMLIPISQPWWEGLGRATEQGGQEEVCGWRSICQSSRMKRQRMLWLTIHGSGFTAIFHHLGWDDQPLLQYIFWSLQ